MRTKTVQLQISSVEEILKEEEFKKGLELYNSGHYGAFRLYFNSVLRGCKLPNIVKEFYLRAGDAYVTADLAMKKTQPDTKLFIDRREGTPGKLVSTGPIYNLKKIPKKDQRALTKSLKKVKKLFEKTLDLGKEDVVIKRDGKVLKRTVTEKDKARWALNRIFLTINYLFFKERTIEGDTLHLEQYTKDLPIISNYLKKHSKCKNRVRINLRWDEWEYAGGFAVVVGLPLIWALSVFVVYNSWIGSKLDMLAGEWGPIILSLIPPLIALGIGIGADIKKALHEITI